MSGQDAVESLASQIITILERNKAMNADYIERVFQAALKKCRENRYYERGPSLEEQKWEPVLREGYEQYLVSNWGFVRHTNRKAILRPALEHQYARAAMFSGVRKSGKAGGHQHMIHELVFESFRLKRTLASLNIQKGIEIINHIDGDKWNPHLENLEPTDQTGNMLHSHNLRRR